MFRRYIYIYICICEESAPIDLRGRVFIRHGSEESVYGKEESVPDMCGDVFFSLIFWKVLVVFILLGLTGGFFLSYMLELWASVLGPVRVAVRNWTWSRKDGKDGKCTCCELVRPAILLPIGVL